MPLKLWKRVGEAGGRRRASNLPSATIWEDQTMKILKLATAAAISVGALAVPSMAADISMAFIVKDMNNPYYARMGAGAVRG